MNAVEILLSDARGIYIPRDFVEGFDVTLWGLDPDSWEVQTCKDPDNLLYWDAWHEILEGAEYRTGKFTFRLHQDGDLFAIDYDRMTEEERKNMGFDEY